MYALSYKNALVYGSYTPVSRDSKRDVGGGGQKWQFQRDVIIEQPLTND